MPLFKIFGCLSLILSVSVCVASTQERENADALQVALPMGDHLPHYGNIENRSLGYLPAVMDQFIEDTETELTLVFMPIRRYVLDMQTGKVDFILPSNPNWIDNHANNLTFSTPLMTSRAAFVRLKKDAGKTIRYVATPTGYTLSKIPPEMQDEHLTIVETITLEAALGMLVAKRVDAVYGHLDMIQRWKNEQVDSIRLVFEDHAGFDDFAYHLSTINHPDIISRFDHWFVENQPFVSRLKRRFGIETTIEDLEKASVLEPVGQNWQVDHFSWQCEY